VLHFGEITARFGDSFACTLDDLWQYDYFTSPSKLSTVRGKLSHPMMVNREGTRDVELEQNFIQLEVPVTLMDLETVQINEKHQVRKERPYPSSSPCPLPRPSLRVSNTR